MRGASLTILKLAVATAVTGVIAGTIDGMVLTGGQISTAAVVIPLTIPAGGGLAGHGRTIRCGTFAIISDALIIAGAVYIVDEQAVPASSPATIASIVAVAIQGGDAFVDIVRTI